MEMPLKSLLKLILGVNKQFKFNHKDIFIEKQRQIYAH